VRLTKVGTFQLDDFSRRRLPEGLDGIGLTLRHEEAIGDYEQRRREWLPTVI
jgi:3-isopropylmalate/(R)-2-methylmalate dehydratase small subunit